MKVIDIKEQEDGSAIVELDVTKEDTELLMQLGFESMLRKGMEMAELENENPVGLELPPTGPESEVKED